MFKELQKNFGTMNYKIYWFLFFNSSGTSNCPSVLKVFRLNLFEFNNEINNSCQREWKAFERSVNSAPNACQLPVFIFSTLLTGSAAH